MYYSTTNVIPGHNLVKTGGLLVGVGTCDSGGSSINDRTYTAISRALDDLNGLAEKHGYNGVIGLTQSTQFLELGVGLSTHIATQCVLMGSGVVVE